MLLISPLSKNRTGKFIFARKIENLKIFYQLTPPIVNLLKRIKMFVQPDKLAFLKI